MTAGETVASIAARRGVPVDTGRTLAEFTTISVGGLRPCAAPCLHRVAAGAEVLRAAGHAPRAGGGANLIAGPGPFTDPIVVTRGIKHGPVFEGHRARAGCGLVVKSSSGSAWTTAWPGWSSPKGSREPSEGPST